MKRSLCGSSTNGLSFGMVACLILAAGCIDADRSRRPAADTTVSTDTSSSLDADATTLEDVETSDDVAPPECGEQIACPAPSAPCAEAACQAGRCVVRQRQAGSSCDDGDPCTGDGQCAGDTCLAGNAVEDGTSCDDGRYCNGIGRCASGECVTTLPGPCPQPDIECVDRWVCSEELLGGCAPVPSEDGSGCKIPDADGECSAGACVPDGMVWVAGGVFVMGCDSGALCPADARPAHDVMMTGFAIDRTEVTEGDWRTCLEKGQCSQRSGESTFEGRDPDEPLRDVSWLGAVEICMARGRKLCAEAQWEKAARGTEGELNFPWGNTLASCDRAVFHDLGIGPGCGEGHPLEVGGRLEGASPYGALDMSGNVAEWVRDAYEEDVYASRVVGTPTDPVHDPDEQQGGNRVLRGGGWATLLDGLRVFKRAAQTLTFFDDEVGVRCCWSPANASEPGTVGGAP